MNLSRMCAGFTLSPHNFLSPRKPGSQVWSAGCTRVYWHSCQRIRTRVRLLTSCVVHPTPANAEDLLHSAAAKACITVRQKEMLLKLGDLLLEVNKQYNLTAIRTREGVIVKHIIDALSLLPELDQEVPGKIIDVGTGAGFPGFVIAIARPEWNVTLLDSVRKKIYFHERVQSELGIGNTVSVWARAEEAGQDMNHRERYDVAVARSLAELRVLAELCIPFVRVNGLILAQKSVDKSRGEITDASTALRKLGSQMESVIRVHNGEEGEIFNKQGDDRYKSIITIRKRSRTKLLYPRPAGTPKKSPL